MYVASLTNKKFKSELNLAVVYKSCCRRLPKSNSFALCKDVNFKSNLVTGNVNLRFVNHRDFSFGIDNLRLKSHRSALENDSKMACTRKTREPSRIRKAKLCRINQKISKRKYLNLYLRT